MSFHARGYFVPVENFYMNLDAENGHNLGCKILGEGLQSASILLISFIENTPCSLIFTDNHKTDLDVAKVLDDKLDDNYVISSRIRTGRNIRGICLSPHVTRGERRAVEKMVSEGMMENAKVFMIKGKGVD